MTTEGFNNFRGTALVLGSDNLWRDLKDEHWDSQLSEKCAGGVHGFFTSDGWMTEWYPEYKVCMQKCPTGWEPYVAAYNNWETKGPGPWQCAPSLTTIEAIVDDVITPVDYGDKFVVAQDVIDQLPDSQVKMILNADRSALDNSFGYLTEAKRLLGDLLPVRLAMPANYYDSLDTPNKYNACHNYLSYTADPVFGLRSPNGVYYMELLHDYFKAPYLHEEGKAFEEDLPDKVCPTGDDVKIWDETEGPGFERAEKARIAAEREAIFQAEQAAQKQLNDANADHLNDPCWGLSPVEEALCKLGKGADDATGNWISTTADKFKWFAIFMVAIVFIK
tara:strand:+ start:179 stop:1180 length:1002 start_codon:yes stop_codon:yes gene_type:complete